MSKVFNAFRFKQQVPATYEIQAGIGIHCVLAVSQIAADGRFARVTAGIREQGDTSLPIGSKLTVRASDLELKGEYNAFTLKVLEVQQIANQSIHKLQLIDSSKADYHRQFPRYPVQIAAVRGSDINFKTANLSESGVQFSYASTLTSAMLDKPMEIHLNIQDGKTLEVTCVPKYILYNWWKKSHRVGAEFMDLSPEQQRSLKNFLAELAVAILPDESGPFNRPSDMLQEPDPVLPPAAASTKAPQTDKKQSKTEEETHTRIDPESGRIRLE